MADYVLDASALLAWLQAEPGADFVEEVLPDCAINAVNLAEAGAKLSDFGMPAAKLAAALDLEIEILPFDARLAMEAVRLRPETRKLGLSLGDRCCLATAKKGALTALTTDRAWEGLKLAGLSIRLLR